MPEIERPLAVTRASRVEAWALVLALAVLAALCLAFALALSPTPKPASASADEGPGNPTLAYHPAQPVEAWHAGRWYPAHIHSAADGRYFITYDDFSISWNEWVTSRRLRPR